MRVNCGPRRSANHYTAPQIKLIGVPEGLGAIGLIAPAALRIAPGLSPVAAVCLAALMVGAVVALRRPGETPAPPIVFAVLCLVIAGLFRLRA